MIDERASFAVARPYPGPLSNLLRSMKKVGREMQSFIRVSCQVEIIFWYLMIFFFVLFVLHLQLPARIALTGEVYPLREEKVNWLYFYWYRYITFE